VNANDVGLENKEQIIRVDSVVLPSWAKSRHHFIAMNYLSLEHPKTTANLHKWIDLIFGEKQQSHEAFNLFKPLTSEVIIFLILEIHQGERR